MSDMNPFGCPAPAGCQTREFPGEPDQIGRVRQFCRDSLAGLPCLEIAQLVATEAASNAVRHTRSGGRSFRVDIAVTAATALLAVRDMGGTSMPCQRAPGWAEEGGRGLLILDRVSERWGFTRDHDGTTVWCELPLAAVDT